MSKSSQQIANDESFDAGRAARAAGQSRTDSPEDRYSARSFSWDSGWMFTWDTYKTGILPWSQRIPANSSMEVIANAMQAELNDFRPAIAQLTAENAALREQLSHKDDAFNTTVNAALMMPDPVREQNAYLLLALRAVADTAQSLMDMATRQKDHTKLMAHGDPVYADIFGKWQATIDAAKADRPAAVGAADQSLLRPAISATNPLPPGCYCPPGTCQAPRIMGRQTPCRRMSNAGVQQINENGVHIGWVMSDGTARYFADPTDANVLRAAGLDSPTANGASGQEGGVTP
jgi:hypothetical protein